MRKGVPLVSRGWKINKCVDNNLEVERSIFFSNPLYFTEGLWYNNSVKMVDK